MGYSSEYTDHKDVASRIARRFPSKQFNDNDIIEWCQVCECDIFGAVDGMYKYLGFPLEVKNHRATLPCNVWRIADIYTIANNPNSRTPFTRLRGQIGFAPTFTLTEVYIDYYGAPIDLETGIPLIQVGHELACEAYCVLMMHEDDYANARITETQYVRFEQKWQAEALAVFGSARMQHKTRGDLNKLDAIAYNMIPKPASMGLLTGNFNYVR